MKTPLFVAALVTLVVACGARAPGESCTPAEQEACSCPDGTQSVRQCKSDGTWGACQCVGQ
jgi:hypothetical protein